MKKKKPSAKREKIETIETITIIHRLYVQAATTARNFKREHRSKISIEYLVAFITLQIKATSERKKSMQSCQIEFGISIHLLSLALYFGENMILILSYTFLLSPSFWSIAVSNRQLVTYLLMLNFLSSITLLRNCSSSKYVN